MGKGAKIAIGCAVAALAVAIAVGVALFGAAWWAKDKLEQVAESGEQVEALRDRANRENPFTPPPDGRIEEPRLEAFLQVRQRVHGVYGKHAAQLEAASKKETAELADLTAAFGMIQELQLAQAQALADVGMSEAEYAFMVEQVYKSMWASEVARETGGKSPSEAAAAAYEEAARQLEEMQGQEGLPAEAREQMKQALEQLRAQSEQAEDQLAAFDVPEENIALFREHEAEIKKYAMSGLEFLGM